MEGVSGFRDNNPMKKAVFFLFVFALTPLSSSLGKKGGHASKAEISRKPNARSAEDIREALKKSVTPAERRRLMKQLAERSNQAQERRRASARGGSSKP